MTAAMLESAPSWQGRLRFAVKKYREEDVAVLETRRGRVTVARRSVAFTLLSTLRLVHLLVAVGPVARRVIPRLPMPRPVEVVTGKNNLLVNAGIDRLEDLLIGAGGTAYNNGNSRIGVGDSNTGAVASQTDLQALAGSTHRQFEVMDATFPSRASETVTWRSTFTSLEANFAGGWQEWCIDNGTAAGTTITTPMLNRKVTSLGTKASGTVWQFTATLTVS